LRSAAQRTSGSNTARDEEIALLPDANWVTEDDADAIMSLRSEQEGGAIPLKDILKEIRDRRVAR